MKAEIGARLEPEIISSFLPAIEKTVESFLKNFDGATRDKIRDKIIDKLMRLEFPKGSAGKEKSRVIVIAKNECRDFLRRYKRHGARALSDWFEMEKQLGLIESKAKKSYIAKSRPHFREIKAALGRRARTIKNLNVYQAWCNGMTRRRMADKFGLTEDQVRGRLATARKNILVTLDRIKTCK